MPSSPRPTHANAAALLAQRDPVIEALVVAVGPPRIGRSRQSPFAALVRSVLYQQLAGSAARAIHGRLIDALDGQVTPKALLSLSPTVIRAAGVSNNKALSLRDLAEKVAAEQVVLDARRLARLDDEQVIEMLSQVRGIGRWTSQMFLLFQLRRLDVWPSGDLGVRRGFALGWNIDLPTERELEALGAPFAPYRSVAAWYCWRACEVFGTDAAR